MLSAQASICARSNSHVFWLRRLGQRIWLFMVMRRNVDLKTRCSHGGAVARNTKLEETRLLLTTWRFTGSVDEMSPRDLAVVVQASFYDSKRPLRRIPSSNWFENGVWGLTVDEISMVGDLDLSFHEEEGPETQQPRGSEQSMGHGNWDAYHDGLRCDEGENCTKSLALVDCIK